MGEVLLLRLASYLDLELVLLLLHALELLALDAVVTFDSGFWLSSR
jgi:hypothetical protein